ncbi:acetoin dehydrogenase dihydrolipoyllysine-residue acetyltransferase subunit [Aureimonas endophytica]|uniref:Acetoin dehydrogenase dihydrolipoyllysine-residue acetyltransferase subunit n=1 Tax=Aureimonas endophytica TaxID=2027858 RepID=A0A916ZN65_9HYPH|nr:alpha/beta fold hydrolase [Aureimonas endophytica]GGE05866.1 acetoin dehydrogenase dihydrolipoyllysine-residue acetyltransferase subunit [Aureimonas endophytica]
MPIDITLTGGAGEYMESATLVEWRAKPGERVEAGALLAVVETAKAATEIEAPASGVLLGPLAEIGAEIAIGTVLGRIAAPGEAEAGAFGAEPSVPAAAAIPAATSPGAAPESAERPDRIRASPLARRLAATRGLDLAEIRGSGPGGRIKSRDLPPPAAARALAPPTVSPASTPARGGADGRPLLVCLHGFGANRLSWSGLLPRLAAAARPLALDLPGHGANGAAFCEFDAIVDALAERIEAEAAPCLHLLGHSLGAALATRLAATGRLPVASLSLLAPAGLGPEIDGAFLSGFLRARESASLRPWLARLVADPALLPAGFAEAVLRERGELGLLPHQERLAASLFPDGTQGFDIRADLARLAMPVKVIVGLADAIIPPDGALRLSGAVALHRLGGTGHMPQLEAPDLVARLVMENMRAGAFTL